MSVFWDTYRGILSVITGKGAAAMKTNYVLYRHSSLDCPAYPNGASTRYYRQKILKIVGGLASGALLTLWLVILMRLA